MNDKMELSRRRLLKASAMALAAGTAPGLLPRANARAPVRRKILVTIFQRFGMDGLMAVSPYESRSLAALRPQLMLSAPGSGKTDARLELGGGYGLHPAFGSLYPFYREGRLALVHGVGSPDNTRAHNTAQMWLETGSPGNARQRDGWMFRLKQQLANDTALLPAVAMTEKRPRIFYGNGPITALPDLDLLALSAGQSDKNMAALEALFRDQKSTPLTSSLRRSLELRKVLASSSKVSATAYPEGSSLGRSLQDIARLIKADVGLQLAFAESRTSPDGLGTWDTHSSAADMDGPFPRMAEDLAACLAAFMDDLGPYRDEVTVVTLTDFGRNVVENARRGADHGRATAMFVLGSDIRGGHVYGSLPEEFSREILEDGMDLPVTTDYRAVLSSIIGQQLGLANSSAIFPGWQGEFPNLMRA